MRSTASGIDTAILTPVFKAYSAVSHARIKRIMNGATGLPVPVCSVGNIAFGGTAKTPTVEYVARVLASHGRRPGIVLRGWMGRLDRENAPAQVVSDGARIRLEWRDCGDEASLLAESLLDTGVPVAVGRNRIEACRLLLDKSGVDVLVLDDAFQYVRIRRDFDLALVDTLVPFGRLDLRTGPLREPVYALQRADAILLTRTESVEKDRMDGITGRLRSELSILPPIFTAKTQVRKISSGIAGELMGRSGLSGKRVTAFTGIGNPLGFIHTLASLGVELQDVRSYPDHHPYDNRDINRINRKAVASDTEWIATTTKDAVRLNGIVEKFELPLCVVEIEIVIDEKDRFDGMVMEKLTGNGR
jgi:tetraacyldisaccharide 4'-kinase